MTTRNARALFCSMIVLACLSAHRAFAQGSPTSSGWAFKCPDGSLPDSNGSCGRSSSGSSSTGANEKAAREREEAAERAAAEAYWRKRKASLDSAFADSVKRAKARANAQRAAAEEKHRQFENNKAEGISELRTELKNTDLKDAVARNDQLSAESSSPRNSSTPQLRKAYGQAFCGMSLLQKAIKNLDSGNDFAARDSKFVVDQAAMVFDGVKPEVACPPVPDVELPRNVNMTDVIAREKSLLKKVDALIARSPSVPSAPLTPDEKRIQEVFKKQQENESGIAEKDAAVISLQRGLNEVQQRKYDPKDAQQIKRDQEAREKLKETVDIAAESLKKGDIQKVLELTVNLDAMFSKRSSQKNK